MKNNSKFTLSLVLVSMFGMGCKKNLTEPLSTQSITQNQLQSITIKTKAVGFQVKQDDTINGLSGTPGLSLENIPANTKQFVIIMDGAATTINAATKPLWIATAPGTLQQIDAQSFGMQQKQVTDGVIQNIISFHRPIGVKSSKTEVFALDRELTPLQVQELKKKSMTRESFKAYCKDPNNKVTLIGSVETIDHVKDLENRIKRLKTELNKEKTNKETVEKKFAEGTGAKNAIDSAKSKIAGLEKDLANLEKKLLGHQKR